MVITQNHGYYPESWLSPRIMFIAQNPFIILLYCLHMVCQKNNLLPHSRIFDKITVVKLVRKFSAHCGIQGLF